MTNKTIPKDITGLIKLLNDGSGARSDLTMDDFAEALHSGASKEPEKFPTLVSAFEARLARVNPTWPEEKQKQRVLSNIATAAVLGDFGLDILWRSYHSKGMEPIEVYDSPENYGETMKLVAQYVGLQGPDLRERIE